MNTNMENPNSGSASAGSPIVPAPNPNPGAPAGQTLPTGGAIDKAKAYDELETRFGTQGKELGEYRQFFQNIAPLLDKLDQSPEMVQAIVDGKLDKDIAKAVLEGRVDVRDAAAVQAAHDQVKTKLGDKAYEATSLRQLPRWSKTKLINSAKNSRKSPSWANSKNTRKSLLTTLPILRITLTKLTNGSMSMM